MCLPTKIEDAFDDTSYDFNFQCFGRSDFQD